jgi:hypothetical protein
MPQPLYPKERAPTTHWIASIPVYVKLIERVTFEVLPLSSCTLNPLLEIFLELLL